jgi:hypothetical protein
MATVGYGEIFAEAAARSASGFSVSANAQVAMVRVLGRSTAVMYRPDAGEFRRRRGVGLGAINRMDHLELLLGLPHGCPVPCASLTGRERQLLRSVPAGGIEATPSTVTRRALAPLRVELAAVRANDWRRGLDHASLFAPFCSRAIVLGRKPGNIDDMLGQAAYYGIGIVLAGAGEVEVLAEPEPFRSQGHKAAGWWFAEEIYAQVSGRAAAGCAA